jgi:hypothetical protein
MRFTLHPNAQLFREIEMATDGTYGFVYCGANGLGVGVFTVQNERFEGTDYGGSRYIGTAKETSDGRIVLSFHLEVPAGVSLVQGTAPQEAPHSKRITQTLPPNFGDGKPQEIQLPPGTVTAMIRRVSDEFASVATSGLTVQIAQKLAAGP